MNAQVLQVGLGDDSADGVRHTADAQLQASVVGDEGHDQVGHCQFVRSGFAAGGELCHGRIVAFHDLGDLRDMDASVIAAQAARHILIDFDDDLFCAVADLDQVGSVGAKVEVTVFIHGCALCEEYAVRIGGLTAVLGHFRVTDGSIEAEAAVDHLTFDAGHMPAVPGEVILCVLHVEHFGLPHQDAAPELHVMQGLQVLCHSVVAGLGGVAHPAPCDPVAIMDALDGFFGGRQLALIQCFVIHKL